MAELIEVQLHNCSDQKTFVFPLTKEGTTIEKIGNLCAVRCGINTIGRHLFGLRVLPHMQWANLSEHIECQNNPKLPTRQFQYRIRYRPASISRLETLDIAAFNYYYHQLREDFLAGKIDELVLREKEKALGLTVTDMLRVMKEQNRGREDVLKDFKNYLPAEVLKNYKIPFYVRKAISKSLAKLENASRSVNFIKEQYISGILKYAPSYTCEQYVAQVDDGGHVKEVKLIIDPFYALQPGLRMTYSGKKTSYIHICSIEELCYISMRHDGTVEISRKNGVPQYFKFATQEETKSFVSSLDGYYRLTEKWTFNLCKELPTPSLLEHKLNKCHGPVGRNFSCKKLFTRTKWRKGTYIIRENRKQDTFRIDLCIEDGKEPQTLAVEFTDDEKYVCLHLSKEHYSSLSDLTASNPNLFLQCLPPSEYDESHLLLCCPESTPNPLAAEKGNSAPVCIRACNFEAKKGQVEVLAGRRTLRYAGTWTTNEGEAKLCSAMVLQDKWKLSGVQEFLAEVHTFAFVQCEVILAVWGVILSPLTAITEHSDSFLGPLDVYLRNHRSGIQEVDLVESATYLAKALWYLEENGLNHGYIRCCTIIVTWRDENSFKVKLSMPGLPILGENEIHWIPPEHYGNFNDSTTSLSADVWAFGTTLWEIFSKGVAPIKGNNIEEAKQLYLNGGRLPQPADCHEDVYKLMLECWANDPDGRKKPQAIMRDINQTLYEVYNSRRTHAYATIYTKGTSSHGGSNTSISSNVTKRITSVEEIPSIASPNWLDNLNNLVVKLDNGDGKHHLEANGKYGCSFDSSSMDEEEMNQQEEEDVKTPPNGTAGEIEWLIEYSQLQMLEKLGQGFYGEVRKASLTLWSGLQNELVAVKQLRKACMSADGLYDLKREISIMQSLNHKNIVKIKGVVEDPVTLLVMEYVPLGSLAVYLRTYKDKLSENLLLKFALDVAEGMDYLAEKRIIHRDLAARNILVATENHVKISDFGLAQVTGQKDYYRLRTNRDLPIRWYAPETMQSWCFTFKSDLWSYGVTLWEMFSFADEPLIEGCKDDELLAALEAGRRLPCPIRCSVSIYNRLMMRTWQRDPNLRPDFTELIQEIHEFRETSE